MNNLKATKRTIASSGHINKLRSDGFIPAILYGGSKKNLPISLKKTILKDIIKTDSFMSSVFDLDIDGSSEKALPRDVAYDPLSDEPIHIDFMRVEKGANLILEIPVKFINQDKSPGLKKGAVLNIVRRKIELKCKAESIPNEIVVDLENSEIGTSIKISSVKLPANAVPTITSRDFVVATIASPTIEVVVEKPAEETAEGEAAVEGEKEGVTEEGKEKVDEKEKSTKKAGEDKKTPPKEKTPPAKDKAPSSKKEPDKKK